MKIKAPSRKHLLKRRLKDQFLHYWLLPEKPKATGRLAQLNKHNKKILSEFQVTALRYEEVK